MSLRDQLLKSGLVTKKQVSQAEAKAKKTEHDAKKNQILAKTLDEEKSKEKIEILQESEAKKQHDYLLNKQRDAFLEERANLSRAKQMIYSHCLMDRNGNIPYYFLEKDTIRKIEVSYWLQELLARGKAGICKPDESVDEYLIVPLSILETIRQIAPQKIITQHSLLNDDEDISA